MPKQTFDSFKLETKKHFNQQLRYVAGVSLRNDALFQNNKLSFTQYVRRSFDIGFKGISLLNDWM